MSHDPVNHPAHYTAGKVECIDAIEGAVHELVGFEAFATGTAIKYLWRWKRKGGIEDLQKAQWYLDRLVDYLKCRMPVTQVPRPIPTSVPPGPRGSR